MPVAVCAPDNLQASPAACCHCGDACGPRAIEDAAGAFCCAGCAAVFHTLQANGFTNFYADGTAPGVSQRELAGRDPGRFAVLDDAAVAGRLLEFDDGRRAIVTLSLPSMHCASCVWLLEQLPH